MATKKKPAAAPKRKPTAAKPGKTKQDPPDGETPPPMIKRVKITVRTPAGPTIPPKRKGNATPAQKAPKTRAKGTGRSQTMTFDRAGGIPAPKPGAAPRTSRRLIEVFESDIPSRGYNYTDGSYTGATPYQRAWELDQAQMNAQQAGQRQRKNEVRMPEEEQWEPLPGVPNKQWASAPKRRTWTKKGTA